MAEQKGKRGERTDLLDFGDEFGDAVVESGVGLWGEARSGRRGEKGIPRRGNAGAFRLVLTEHGEVRCCWLWLMLALNHFTTVSERNDDGMVRGVKEIFE